MTIINNFIENLPQILLSLPIVLIALSFHELAHGFVAMKLGDNTAKNFGRLTMNPLKHIDIIGFISMVLFHFGWAKPVPIQSRNFKKPRRDMALTGLAGPVSNIILAIISVLLLRLVMLIMGVAMPNEINLCIKALFQGSFSTISASVPFIIMSIISFMLYLGVILNLSLALFNLIPIPPLDGSRIFYVFLPTNLYFGIMKYEQYISMAMFLLLMFTDIVTYPLSIAIDWLANGLCTLTAMPLAELYGVLSFVSSNLFG